MNLELRKERKEKKGAPREEHFVLLLLSFFSYFSNRSRSLCDQTSTFSVPGTRFSKVPIAFRARKAIL